VVLASLASALIILPIVQPQAKNPELSRRLATLTEMIKVGSSVTDSLHGAPATVKVLRI